MRSITFDLPHGTNSTFILKDTQGRKVIDSIVLAGRNKIMLGFLETGVYFYSIAVNGEIKTGKLAILKEY